MKYSQLLACIMYSASAIQPPERKTLTGKIAIKDKIMNERERYCDKKVIL